MKTGFSLCFLNESKSLVIFTGFLAFGFFMLYFLLDFINRKNPVLPRKMKRLKIKPILIFTVCLLFSFDASAGFFSKLAWAVRKAFKEPEEPSGGQPDDNMEWLDSRGSDIPHPERDGPQGRETTDSGEMPIAREPETNGETPTAGEPETNGETPPETAEEITAGRWRMEQADEIEGVLVRGAHTLARERNDLFEKTLGEILKQKGIRREDIPKEVLDDLRAATSNPLKLIDFEDSPEKGFRRFADFNEEELHGVPYKMNVVFFSLERASPEKARSFLESRFPESVRAIEAELFNRDIYRAFFQKRLDPENQKQMDRLGDLINRLAGKFNTARQNVLRLLCRYDDFEWSSYDDWAEELLDTLYGRETLKRFAENSFKDGFNRELFFDIWDNNEAFREFIVYSHFMTKDHLTGNMELLLRWSSELEAQEYKKQLAALVEEENITTAVVEIPPPSQSQLATLIEDSFESASYADDIDKAIAEDPFWQTVVEGTREDSSFNRIADDIVRSITPFDGDRSLPLPPGAKPSSFDTFPPGGGTHTGGMV